MDKRSPGEQFAHPLLLIVVFMTFVMSARAQQMIVPTTDTLPAPAVATAQSGGQEEEGIYQAEPSGRG